MKGRVVPAAISMLSLALLPAARAADSPSSTDCAPARDTLRVESRVTGGDTLAVRYTVYSHLPIRWVRIGAGDTLTTVIVPQQIPHITATPIGWRSQLVVPEETRFFHLWWEAVQPAAVLPAGRPATGFAILVPGPKAVSRGLLGMDGKPVRPIDWTTLPFTVGTTDGSCWWGRVRPANSVFGRWEGKSICVKADWNSACNDETVRYDMIPVAATADSVDVHAEKLVNGSFEWMGDLRLGLRAADQTWSREFKAPRNGKSVVWRYMVRGDSLLGTLTERPSGRLIRTVRAAR